MKNEVTKRISSHNEYLNTKMINQGSLINCEVRRDVNSLVPGKGGEGLVIRTEDPTCKCCIKDTEGQTLCTLKIKKKLFLATLFDH
jgi:hypothetical protein